MRRCFVKPVPTVTVTDLKNETQLQAAISQLKGFSG